MPPPEPPLAAIFDLDGTLCDSEPVYFRCYAAAMASLGFSRPYTFEEHHIHLLGRPELEGAKLCSALLGGRVTPEEFIAERDRILLPALRDVRPCAGAVEAADACSALGMKLAIATSSDRELIAVKSNEHMMPVFDRFPVLVSATDPVMRGKKGKPDPAIYLCAADMLGVPPERCVAIEDSASGMRSARAAGMWTVGVPDPRLDRGEMERLRDRGEGAHVLLWGGLEELRPEHLMGAGADGASGR
ncbi:HAD-like domain-containing protein [Hyaloraphidium curvatum]|nr:HAD-like domain-containing protein [Hyaloraphidium curvatum]